MNDERKRVIRSVLLAVEGGLIILGGALQFVYSPVTFRADQFAATDITMASIALGAGLILAFRQPSRNWVNIALLYNGLAILAWAYNYFGNNGTRLTPVVLVISVLFALGLILTYPRGAEGLTTAPA